MDDTLIHRQNGIQVKNLTNFFFRTVAIYLVLYLSKQNLVSREAKNLIDIMLDTDPVKRVTATQALRHPWIANKEKIAQSVHRQVKILRFI